MRILAVSGSLRADSFNTSLLRAAAEAKAREFRGAAEAKAKEFRELLESVE